LPAAADASAKARPLCHDSATEISPQLVAITPQLVEIADPVYGQTNSKSGEIELHEVSVDIEDIEDIEAGLGWEEGEEGLIPGSFQEGVIPPYGPPPQGGQAVTEANEAGMNGTSIMKFPKNGAGWGTFDHKNVLF